MKLQECIDKYIEDNMPYLKERTTLTYQGSKTRYINIFGNIDINEFTQDFSQNYINECQKTQGTKKSTLQNRLSLLLLALKPYKRFAPFKYIRVNADSKEKNIYSESDITKIQDYIIKHPKLSYIPIIIAIHTGMRVSEICGLKWGDIDFDNRTISINRTATKLHGQEIISTPKTKNGVRNVYITDTLYEYLKKYASCKNYYICSGSENVKPVRSCQRSNELLCRKIGVRNCGMHAYRHAFATALLKHSTDFKSISEVMGHANIAITQNIYNHTTQARKNDVIKMAFEDAEEKREESKTPPPVIDYQPQINALQTQINGIRTIIARLMQYVQDNTQQAEKQKIGKPKYRTVDSYGNKKYFTTKKDLLEDLDITTQTLTKHLNGFPTVLDELEIYVEEKK